MKSGRRRGRKKQNETGSGRLQHTVSNTAKPRSNPEFLFEPLRENLFGCLQEIGYGR